MSKGEEKEKEQPSKSSKSKKHSKDEPNDYVVGRIDPKYVQIPSWIDHITPSSLSTDGSRYATILNSGRDLDFYYEKVRLENELSATIKELNEAKKNQEETQEIVAKFEKINEQLEAKHKINHVLTRISKEGRDKVLQSEDFLSLFQDKTPCDAVVVSIDIRRSTELMLKARKPELFSEFITDLTHKLSESIINNLGIFDKFTGDGILSFFPKFYSGDHAIIRAIKAAQECHEIFSEHYNSSRECFSVFIKDVGLGIGIDFGNVTLVNTTNELTVVGVPVVYACRMSSAKAGTTILNQPAKEEVDRLAKKQAKFIETDLLIKNEGHALVYQVDLNPYVFENLKEPQWILEGKNGDKDDS